jgi:hypothetical protein
LRIVRTAAPGLTRNSVADRLQPAFAAPAFGAAGVAVVVLVTSGNAVVAFAIALFAPILVAIARRPQFGILLFVALAPFDGLRLLVEIPVVGAAGKFVLAGLVLAATFVCPHEARAQDRRRLPRWAVPLSGFVLVGLASAVAVGFVQGGVGLKFNFAYLLVAWAVWRCPLDARDRDRLVSIFMVTALVAAVVGIAQQVLGSVAVHNLGYDYNSTIRFIGSRLRSFSTFENAPAFALYVSLALLMGVPQALRDTKRFRNRCFLLLIPVYLLGMGTSFTRSGLLAFAAGVLYLGLRRYRVVIAVLPLVLLAFLFFGGNVTETLSSSSSLTERTSGWQANVDQVRTHPLGAGIGAVGGAAETVNELTGRTGRYQPDNYFFKTAYELGLLGLWMLVLFLIAAVISTHTAADRLTGMDQAFADGVTATIVGAIVASFTASYFEIFPMDMLFWLLLTVVATMDARPAETGASRPTRFWASRRGRVPAEAAVAVAAP